MRDLHYSVVLKRELSRKAKLSVLKAIIVPILAYGHESWKMTERVWSQMQASEIKFLRKIKGFTMFDKVRNATVRESFDIESLRIERFQLRWFGHVSIMPHERLPKQSLFAEVIGKRPIGRPRRRRLNYIKDLGWNRLGLHQSEIQTSN